MAWQRGRGMHWINREIKKLFFIKKSFWISLCARLQLLVFLSPLSLLTSKITRIISSHNTAQHVTKIKSPLVWNLKKIFSRVFTFLSIFLSVQIRRNDKILKISKKWHVYDKIHSYVSWCSPSPMFYVFEFTKQTNGSYFQFIFHRQQEFHTNPMVMHLSPTQITTPTMLSNTTRSIGSERHQLETKMTRSELTIEFVYRTLSWINGFVAVLF